MLADVADASKRVRISVGGGGVCEVVMCTKCALITSRQLLHNSDALGRYTPFDAGEHPGLGSVLS